MFCNFPYYFLLFLNMGHNNLNYYIKYQYNYYNNYHISYQITNHKLYLHQYKYLKYYQIYIQKNHNLNYF